MLRKIGVALAVIVIAFSGYVAVLPEDYVISREITIQASADQIFPFLNSQKLADQWMPWNELDPESRTTYSGPETGIGAVGNWAGGKYMGTGSATITESILNQKVVYRLEYTEPHAMVQEATYLLKPVEGGTKVTWQVTGKNNFISRAMCVFVNMDKLVGSNFEKGLSNLKTLVESQGGNS
jgi:hypothetical protein